MTLNPTYMPTHRIHALELEREIRTEFPKMPHYDIAAMNNWPKTGFQLVAAHLSDENDNEDMGFALYTAYDWVGRDGSPISLRAIVRHLQLIKGAPRDINLMVEMTEQHDDMGLQTQMSVRDKTYYHHSLASSLAVAEWYQSWLQRRRERDRVRHEEFMKRLDDQKVLRLKGTSK